MKLFYKIFPLRFNKKKEQNQPIQKNQDELIGLWENDLDDGSGLHAIWGWSFNFKEDGTGIHYTWDNGNIEREMDFVWRRLNANSFQAKFVDDDEWDVVNYTLSIVDAPYSGLLYKMVDNNYEPTFQGEDGFWGMFGAVFRYK